MIKDFWICKKEIVIKINGKRKYIITKKERKSRHLSLRYHVHVRLNLISQISYIAQITFL